MTKTLAAIKFTLATIIFPTDEAALVMLDLVAALELLSSRSARLSARVELATVRDFKALSERLDGALVAYREAFLTEEAFTEANFHGDEWSNAHAFWMDLKAAHLEAQKNVAAALRAHLAATA